MAIKNLLTVTVGIPAYNEQYNIGKILKQVLEQKQLGFKVEKIIVASDGSTDDTVKIACTYENKGVTVIDGKQNRGQNYRQNEIIKSSTSDILVLLNADIKLSDKYVLHNLIHPITKGADLTAQWAKPVKANTFLERVLIAGFDFKYYIYERFKKGNNMYTCVGHMRAIAKNFYTNIVFPLESGGEDQYLYLFCVAKGYKYIHAKKANAFFRLPSNWLDYKRYAKRIFHTQVKHEDIFSYKIIVNERNIPFRYLIQAFVISIIKSPFYTLLYICLHILMQKWAKKQTLVSSQAFAISESTKKL